MTCRRPHPAPYSIVRLSDNPSLSRALLRLSSRREPRDVVVEESRRKGCVVPKALPWGRRYVMVRPDHFRVDYRINPYMDLEDQPDAGRAMAQWDGLVSVIEGLGGTVEVVPQRADAPDMVYAMNLGLGVVRPVDGHHVVMSHMRYAERRMETQTAQAWFERSGWSTSYVGRDGIGAHLEAGDVFAWGGALVAGYGPRT